MQFQRDWPKEKNYSFFKFLPENLEKFRSSELYGAPLKGSTICLCRSSLGSMAMESCPLPELKYAFSEGQDVRLKNYCARGSFFGQPLTMGS